MNYFIPKIREPGHIEEVNASRIYRVIQLVRSKRLHLFHTSQITLYAFIEDKSVQADTIKGTTIVAFTIGRLVEVYERR